MIKILPKNSSGEILISITLDEALNERIFFKPELITKISVLKSDGSLELSRWTNSPYPYSDENLTIQLIDHFGTTRYMEIQEVLNAKILDFITTTNYGQFHVSKLNLL